MARLPVPGSDDNVWGDVLNEYLSIAHQTDGTIKSGAVSAASIQNNSITAAKLESDSVTAAKLADDSVTTPKLSTASAPSGGQVLSYDGSGLDWVTPVSGVSDHGALTGLGDDDHAQYHNDTRGDVRYYTKTQSDTALADKADLTDPRFTDTRTPTDNTVTSAKIQDGAIINADINASAAIAQSKIANLTTDLTGKEPVITGGTTAQYWRGDKSWQTLDKSAVGLGNVDNTTDASKPVSTATQTALNAKLDDKNEVVALTDSTNDRFVRVNITDDASPTGSWPDRLAFYFDSTRSGYFNEYGELRARPAKSSTVALRAMGWNGASTADVFEVANSTQSTVYLGVGPTAATLTVPISSNSNITTTGTVTGSNIGNKVTTSATAPSSPSVGDVWVDTST